MKKSSMKIITGILLTSTVVLIQPQPVSAATNWGSLISGVIGYSKEKSALEKKNREGSEQIFLQEKLQDGVDEDPNKNEQLRRIMTNLTTTIGKKEKIDPEYKYFVNQHKDFNAYCGLAHTVSVNSGLFDVLQNNEEEIAFVLAHEIVHGQKNHNVSQKDKQLSIGILSTVLAKKTNNANLGKITNNYLVARHATLPDEWQADNISFTYVVEAGYNPGAGAAVWTRVRDKYGDVTKDFLGNILKPSDHPTNTQRINNYSKKLTEYGNGKVAYNPATSYVMVNKKQWFKVAGSGDTSADERGFLIAGKVARAFHNSTKVERATVVDGNVMIGKYQVATPNQEEKSPEAAVQALNAIL